MMFSIVFAIKTFPKWSYPSVQFFISYIGDRRCCMYKKWNWDQEIHFRGITRRLSNCCNLTSVNGSSSSFCPPVAYYDLQGLHLDDQKETSHLRQRWTGSRTWNNVISAKCTGYLEKMSLKSISCSRAYLYQPLWTALKSTLLMCTSKIHLSISLNGTHLCHGFVSEWILGRTT